MGLDTSHDCWHGAYSAFSRWRDIIAKTAGYKFVKFDDGFDRADIEWDWFDDKNFLGEWDIPPEDPLLLLLVHSDNDGVIHPEHAPWLAERLERLLPLIPADMDGGGHIGNVRAKTQSFIDGLRLAATADEDVDFH